MSVSVDKVGKPFCVPRRARPDARACVDEHIVSGVGHDALRLARAESTYDATEVRIASQVSVRPTQRKGTYDRNK
jgi:hypothetical protein